MDFFLLVQLHYTIKQSKAYYQDSIDIGESIDNVQGIGICYLNLAEIAFKQKNIQEAQSLLNRALKIHYDTNDHIGIAYAVSLQAEMLYEENNTKKAIELLKEAKVVLSETEDKYNLVLVNKKLLDIYWTMEKFDDFEDIAFTSINIAKEIKSNELVATISIMLSEYYEKNSLINKALELYKYGSAFKMQAQNENIKQKQKNIEIQFKINKTEHENELITRYNNVLTSKNEELNNLYKNISTISIIGKQITSTLKSNEIYMKTYESLLGLTSIDFFGIVFLDQKTKKIIPEFFIDKGEIIEIEPFPIRDKNSLASHSIINNIPILLNDLQTEYHNYKNHIDDSNIHSVIYVPIIHGTEVLGAMTIQSEQISIYSTNDLHLIEALSSYFAIAIKNAKISESLQKEVLKRKTIQTSLERLNSNYLQLSRIDSLTNIPNRRRLQEFLEDVINIHTRKQIPFAVLIIDIDHFKEYNDNYGHVKGDKAIKKVSKILKNSIQRDSDFISRYGGDEFVVVLPDITIEGCKIIASRFAENIRNNKINHSYSPTKSHITVSIGGYCNIPNIYSTMDSVLQEADRFLYQSKTFGRDTIVINEVLL
ncbi:MAG: GGDEF domain-containing protein [Bacillota bacterium]|nr:GGDEF domain-containing protein [Bacillota bacterium]